MTEAVPGIFNSPTPTVAYTSQVEKLTKADAVLDSLMGRVTTPSEIKHLKSLIYCRPGIGKTTFCGSAPNPFILDVDGTTVTLKKNPDTANIPTIPFVSEYQVEKIIERMIDGSLEDRIYNEYHTPVDVFCLDSFTVFQVTSLKTQIRAQMGIKDDKTVESMLTRYLSVDMNWPANTQYCEDIITQISKIPKHVIITAHVKKEKDNSTGVDRFFTRPDLTQKIYVALSRWANVIGYMEKDPGGNRTLQIQPTSTIDAKSHIGGPDKIQNPTFQSLLDIKDGKK